MHRDDVISASRAWNYLRQQPAQEKCFLCSEKKKKTVTHTTRFTLTCRPTYHSPIVMETQRQYQSISAMRPLDLRTQTAYTGNHTASLCSCSGPQFRQTSINQLAKVMSLAKEHTPTATPTASLYRELLGQKTTARLPSTDTKTFVTKRCDMTPPFSA